MHPRARKCATDWATVQGHSDHSTVSISWWYKRGNGVTYNAHPRGFSSPAVPAPTVTATMEVQHWPERSLINCGSFRTVHILVEVGLLVSFLVSFWFPFGFVLVLFWFCVGFVLVLFWLCFGFVLVLF